MVTRRRILGSISSAGVTTLLAGCQIGPSQSELSIHFEAVSVDDLGEKFLASADEMEPRARRVAEEGVTDGITVHGTLPIESESVVRMYGTYYEVKITERGTEQVQRPILEATEVSSANGSIGDWADLNDSDSLLLRCAIATRDDRDGHPCVIYAGNESAFWPNPPFRYLESGDSGYYRLRTSTQTVTLDRYHYTFEPVAESQSAFSTYAAQELVAIDFSTGDLSTAERDILETTATEGVYRESPPPYSDALRGLVERLRSARPADDGVYVRFDGSYYDAHTQQFFDD